MTRKLKTDADEWSKSEINYGHNLKTRLGSLCIPRILIIVNCSNVTVLISRHASRSLIFSTVQSLYNCVSGKALNSY